MIYNKHQENESCFSSWFDRVKFLQISLQWINQLIKLSKVTFFAPWFFLRPFRLHLTHQIFQKNSLLTYNRLIDPWVLKFSFPVFSRVKLYAVFQGLQEEGFDLSSILASEFLRTCSEGKEKLEKHAIQKILKSGMSLGKFLNYAANEV